METVTSKDGTKVAYEKTGEGPALILIGGAFQDHQALSAHAALLSKDFTVYNYDRRGRGESGDTQPYAIMREVEDIDAIIEKIDGPTFVFGGSSGAVLALDAAAHNPQITKLALYEPPFVVDSSRPPVPEDFVAQLRTMLSEDRRGDAAEAYLTLGAQMPANEVAQMRGAPYWVPAVESAAHTLLYDAIVMDGTMTGRPLPKERWESVKMPTLVMVGAKGLAWARSAADALVNILPDATQETLTDQAHDLSAESLAPVLVKFFIG